MLSTVLFDKFKDTVLSVLPITILVILLNFTIAPIGALTLIRFVIGSVFIILGLSVFLLGVDLSIQPVGNTLGAALVRRKNLPLLIIAGFLVGFFINVAEPDLFVLASQIEEVTGGLLSTEQILVVVSIGIGIMIAIGLVRVIFQIPLRNMLIGIYLVVLVLAIWAPNSFLGIAFDSGGATTGSMTVPFILALGLGISSVHGGKEGEEDSFGLTGVASGGPMIAVLSMALISGLGGLTAGEELVEEVVDVTYFGPFLHEFPIIAMDVGMAIAPLFIITLIAQRFLMHMPRRAFRRVVIGFVYTYLGFVFFLTGVNAGFMNAGQILGETVAALPDAITILVGALIGLLVILAEPSVHVLTAQIEDITGGTIGKKAILIALALGVSTAIALSVFRIITPGVELWYLLLGGYGLALLLSRFTPTLFVGIGFDSGGVASGPMTATFVLAFAQGVAVYVGGSMGILDAFGVIALVALTPLIALQIFGLLYQWQERRQTTEETSDEA